MTSPGTPKKAARMPKPLRQNSRTAKLHAAAPRPTLTAALILACTLSALFLVGLALI